MRHQWLAGMTVAALLVTGCAQEKTPSSAGGPRCDKSGPPLYAPGTLTVATDDPVFPPWFQGSSKHYSGFEGDLATAIARDLGLPIKWVVEPFNKSYAPGQKDYDFDINEISITPERDRAVDFSDGYFHSNQAVLALEGEPITRAKSLADLAKFQLGTQVGTTSLKFINEKVRPDMQAKVFDTTSDATTALQNGAIDGLMTDVPTTVYLRDFVVKGSVVLGQYPTNEQFGMLFEEGNPLVECINDSLAKLESKGTLERLQNKWLQNYLRVPTLSDS
ncbi:ABC transporter substrate-binding protein [soil metagenome]